MKFLGVAVSVATLACSASVHSAIWCVGTINELLAEATDPFT